MTDPTNRRFTTTFDALQTWVRHAHECGRGLDSTHQHQVLSYDDEESQRVAMLRDVVQDLVSFRPEADLFRDEMLALINKHGAHLTERSCLPDHVTASAAVIRCSDYAMAMMHHVKLNRWLQPGGHADGQVDLRVVAQEEAQEESGIDGLTLIYPPIDCDIHEVPYRGPATPTMPDGSVVRHLDVRFLVLADGDAQLIGNHESTAVQWVTREQLSELTNEANLMHLYSTAVACAQAFI